MLLILPLMINVLPLLLLETRRPYPWGWTVAGIGLKKVKERLGLQNAKALISGAAPIHRDVVEYFMGFNLPVLEVYGMSENTGPSNCNTLADWKLGTVGKNLCGTKVKIFNPDEQGEGEVNIAGTLFSCHLFVFFLYIPLFVDFICSSKVSFIFSFFSSTFVFHIYFPTPNIFVHPFLSGVHLWPSCFYGLPQRRDKDERSH